MDRLKVPEISGLTRGSGRKHSHTLSESDRLTALERAGVPTLFLDARVSDFEFPAPEFNDHGLFISGPVGVGKSRLAAAILAEKLSEVATVTHVYSYPPGHKKSPDTERLLYTVVKPNVAYVSVRRMLRKLRRTFSEGTTETETAVLDAVIKPELILFDDIGAEKSSEWTREQICYIISERIDACRPSLITSNLSIEEISKNIDERLGSRFGGMAEYTMEGPDRRLDIGKRAANREPEQN